MADELRERALRLLSRREHTRAELQRKLTADAETADRLAAVLDDLAARGLLSDARFADQRVSSRSARLGDARLVHELRTRGVAESLIGEAMNAAGDEVGRAGDVWRKKFGTKPADRREWGRQARFLQSRGFSADTVRRVLDTPADEGGDD